MIKKIMSGGQTGADKGGLIAASICGIRTGGWAPKGYRTQAGIDLDLRDIYGLLEHPSPKYPPRTYDNVKESDGTIRIATDFSSPGERCTLNAIREHDKPSFDVWFPENVDDTLYEAYKWINYHNIETLNVAGNSEGTSPLIEEFTVGFLCLLFYVLRTE